MRTVLDDIDPAIGLQEVGTKIREDAKAFVAAGFPNKWSRWEHAKRLIIEHDGEDDPVPEGFEACGYEIDHESSDDDDDDDDYHDDGDDGDGKEDVIPALDGDDGDPGGGAESGADADDRMCGSDAARGVEEGDADAPREALDSDAAALKVAEAREVMIAHFRATRDDTSLRRMLRLRDDAKTEEKESVL